MSIRLSGSHGTWVLPDGKTLFGRSTRCGICLLDARLSRQHVGFEVVNNALTISDLGSTNGVLVNGRPFSGTIAVKHSDQIVIGPCLLTVRITNAPAPATVIAGETEPASERRVAEVATKTAIGNVTGWPGRKISSLIAAALTPSKGPDKKDSDTHKPSDYREPGTEAVTLNKKEVPAASLLAPEVRAAILSVAHESALTVHDEPAPPGLWAKAPTSDLLSPPNSAPTIHRLAAGVLDALQTSLISLVISAPIAVFGYALAMHQADAVIRDGLPRLADHSDIPASLLALAGSLLQPGGLAHAKLMAGQLQHHGNHTAFLILYIAVTFSVLVFFLTHLSSTVVATVLRGGPFWHRWLGLNIVDVTTNASPNWSLAMHRWCLLLVLWPLAVVSTLAK